MEHLQLWGTGIFEDKEQTQRAVKEALQAIDAIKTVQGKVRRSHTGVYQGMNRLDTRKSGKDTFWTTYDQMDEYSERPPPRVDLDRWRAKHHIAWNFGLRHNEIDNVDPLKDITYAAVHDTWWCKVREPKIDKLRKIQNVSVKGCYLTSKSKCILFDCIAKKDLRWAGRWSDTMDLTHLRAIVGHLAEQNNEVVTYHSLRHGRITELSRIYCMSTEELLNFGRWVRASNLKLYRHI